MINKNAKSLLTMLVMTVMMAFTYTTTIAATTGDDVTTIKLPSMQCGSCKKKITKALQKVEGVKEVKVDLETKEVKVTFDNSAVDVSKLESAITAAGYDA